VDSPQPIGEIKVPVQTIELEEVQMIEVSDDLLEASCRLVGLFTSTICQEQCGGAFTIPYCR
jgi:hypothetical protein